MADDASGDGSDERTGGFGVDDAVNTESGFDADGRGRPDAGGDDSDRDWIPLDLSSDSGDDGANEDDGYAPEPSSTPIEAGDPDLENAIFVVLGAIVMMLVIARVISIPL